ncbi:MAG: hypothetical protein U9Q68_03870, partial [Euryarchaeota archaeon]|nr:hypothetical protein [Euryarchaeota archaeon]
MINFPWILPTIDEPMSSYTAMAFAFMGILGVLVVTLGYHWLKQEFDGIHTSLDEHDGFVERTSDDISEMRTDIAVLLERCGRSHDDIA